MIGDNMTYRELRDILNAFPEERLNDTATVYLIQRNEAIAVQSIQIVNEVHDLCGVLDNDHRVLEVDF